MTKCSYVFKGRVPIFKLSPSSLHALRRPIIVLSTYSIQSALAQQLGMLWSFGVIGSFKFDRCRNDRT